MIAKPLSSLLKKNTHFRWDEKCQIAFDTLKEALLNDPILTFPNYEKDYYIFSDACSTGIGAILTQKYGDSYKPIHYMSKTLNNAQQKYSATLLEAFAIKEAVRYYIPFVEGNKVYVYSDHLPLKGLINAKNRS